MGLVLAGVAHVPCISGSGVCICVYLYKIVWFGQLQRVSPTSRPGFRHSCSYTSRTPHQAMSDSADHP